MNRTRLVRDSMGELKVPAEALWGAQTQRALNNFPVSNLTLPRDFLRSLGLIKASAARVNASLGLLDSARADSIARAAEEVAGGTLDDHFPVDVFQTGSGTSSNMNANEVIATRASAGMGEPVHPNDHVNLGKAATMLSPRLFKSVRCWPQMRNCCRRSNT